MPAGTPNALTPTQGTKWTAQVQTSLEESFVGMNIASTAFQADFNGRKSINFPRIDNISLETMTDSHFELTPQQITATDDIFTLDQEQGAAANFSVVEFLRMTSKIQNEFLTNTGEEFSRAMDTNIFANYANAATVADAGAFTGGTAGTPAAITTGALMLDFIQGVGQAMDEGNVPKKNRWIALDPKRARLLKNAPNLVNLGTQMAETVLKAGYVGHIDGFDIYESNNTALVTTTRHLLAGQGKPISFAAPIHPDVQVVEAKNLANVFYDNFKFHAHYGSKVFYHDGFRLWDCQIVD